ncbi:hypothetical protein [Streptomyces sp. A1136]|uniref:hypothetical protein n=1 Tax=Streptomyces sp. A1136 TaxID=2563102 RepID=UPI00109E7AD9|nr:hypothetical protein [Streptomyces sp. A1136]THA57255.1 hypothetical protein E6R62_08135 [Streptomyces sp. A1136]
MYHEAVPETRRQHTPTGRTGQAAHDPAAAPDPRDPAAPAPEGGAPKGLLQQMEELLAALNADLSRLDADLLSSTDRTLSSTSPAAVGPTRSDAMRNETTRNGPAPDGDGAPPRSA